MNRDLEPAGIGGWLLLPALGLIISPILQGIGIIRDVVPALNPDVLRTLTDPTSANYSAMWVPTMAFESITSVLMFAFTLWLVFSFFFRKSPRVPRLFVVWLATALTIQVIDWLLTKSLPLPADPSGNGLINSLGRSIINAAIWIPYFIRSIRVKNTFIDAADA